MKYFFTLFLLLLSLTATAQNFEVTGKVVDSSGIGLASATIYLEKPADSSLVTYTVSEASGNFKLSGASSQKKLNLFISYAGFIPLKKSITIKGNLKLGNIAMQLQNNALDEVTLVANRAPVTLKKDTLEFNAGSFKTRQNANLEDLMKKLPGVEVDSDGNITINGKSISSIKVNGKEFFGDDPKIATKNLPKEIIDKIQVSDSKTKSEEFTGKAGDPDNKTVNITLKKDKNKGLFARGTAGGGTNHRYELSGIGNYFKDDLRLSVLASSNNINSSGFTYDEVFGMMSGQAGRAVFNDNSGGITKAETAGFNFVDNWNKKYDLNTDYFFGRNNTQQRTNINRENILPDSTFYRNSENRSNIINNNHRANARFEIEFDTLTRLSISPSFSANIGNNLRNGQTETLDEDRNLVNNSSTREDEDLKSTNFNNNIDFIKRFGSRGAYLQLRFSQQYRNQENDNFYYSESNFINNPERDSIQDQYINRDEYENQYDLEATQRSVLAKDLFLDVSYEFETSKTNSSRFVYNANETGEYSNLNTNLSTDFVVKSTKNIPSLGLNYEGETWRVETNFGLLNTKLENTNYLEESSFDNNYNNLYVNARIRYEVERSQSVYIDYSTNADIPTINQLQPVEDRTDPLNIFVGNPALRPEYSHNIRAGYRNFDFETRSGLFSYVSVDFTQNNVVPVTTTNENFVRTTTYTNVDGTVGANAGLFFSKRYTKDVREFQVRLGLNASYDKNVGFSNAVKYNAKRYTLSPNLRLTYAIEDYFELQPNYDFSYNNTRYSINEDRNEDFINHRVGIEATTYWPKHVVFGNDISYNYFGNVSPGFDNSSILWNLSLGYEFLDDDAALKLKIYDVLDQNIDTRRVVGDDFVQDVNSLILKRYAMLSFTYKLSKFGGKQGGRRGGPSGRRR